MKNPRQHRHQLVAITQRNGNYCYYYYLIVYVNTYKHFSRGKFKRKRKVRYDNVNHHEKGNKKKRLCVSEFFVPFCVVVVVRVRDCKKSKT